MSTGFVNKGLFVKISAISSLDGHKCCYHSFPQVVKKTKKWIDSKNIIIIIINTGNSRFPEVNSLIPVRVYPNSFSFLSVSFPFELESPEKNLFGDTHS